MESSLAIASDSEQAEFLHAGQTFDLCEGSVALRAGKVCLQGESREPKKDMVYVDAEGHVKHVKDGDAQLVERQRKGAAVGKAMRVVAGTHAGLLCSVLEIEPKVPYSHMSLAHQEISNLMLAVLSWTAVSTSCHRGCMVVMCLSPSLELKMDSFTGSQ